MTWLRLPIAAVLILATALSSAAQKATFSVKAEEVRIDVLVTDRGKPVSELTAADFEIFDNGIPQEIQYATLQKQSPISATFVFDMSRSVDGQLLVHLKEAASTLLANLKKDDIAALITFNNAVVLGSSPTRDFQGIRLSLDRVEPYGNSSLFDGSYAGLILAESRPEPPLLIIFSDGKDTYSFLSGEAVLQTARLNDSVVAYAVSTGSRKNNAFLDDLTKITGGSLFEVESTGNLAAVFLGILDEFRQRYLITYTPKGVPGEGWHKVEVRVKRSSCKVSGRPGYVRSSPAE